MEFAVDYIIEDIALQMQPQEQEVNRVQSEELERVQDISQIQIPDFTSQRFEEQKQQEIIAATSSSVDYNSGVIVGNPSTTMYSNQVLYKDDGSIDWVCKCCEFLLEKVGDAYSPTSKFKQ